MSKVLIVEDDRSLSEALKIKLESEGFSTIVVTNAKTGLYDLSTDKPDLIILDIILPGGMHGFDFLERLRKMENFAKTPVIIMSNLDSEKKSAAELGVSDYFVKSNIDLASVVARVKQILASK